MWLVRGLVVAACSPDLDLFYSEGRTGSSPLISAAESVEFLPWLKAALPVGSVLELESKIEALVLAAKLSVRSAETVQASIIDAFVGHALDVRFVGMGSLPFDRMGGAVDRVRLGFGEEGRLRAAMRALLSGVVVSCECPAYPTRWRRRLRRGEGKAGTPSLFDWESQFDLACQHGSQSQFGWGGQIGWGSQFGWASPFDAEGEPATSSGWRTGWRNDGSAGVPLEVSAALKGLSGSGAENSQEPLSGLRSESGAWGLFNGPPCVWVWPPIAPLELDRWCELDGPESGSMGARGVSRSDWTSSHVGLGNEQGYIVGGVGSREPTAAEAELAALVGRVLLGRAGAGQSDTEGTLKPGFGVQDRRTQSGSETGAKATRQAGAQAGAQVGTQVGTQARTQGEARGEVPGAWAREGGTQELHERHEERHEERNGERHGEQNWERDGERGGERDGERDEWPPFRSGLVSGGARGIDTAFLLFDPFGSANLRSKPREEPLSDPATRRWVILPQGLGSAGLGSAGLLLRELRLEGLCFWGLGLGERTRTHRESSVENGSSYGDGLEDDARSKPPLGPHALGGESVPAKGVRWISPFGWRAGFSGTAAMLRNRLIYAFADETIVFSCRLGVGGTWGGAVSALREGRRVRVAPLSAPHDAGTSTPEAFRALMRMGAVPFNIKTRRDPFIQGSTLIQGCQVSQGCPVIRGVKSIVRT